MRSFVHILIYMNVPHGFKFSARFQLNSRATIVQIVRLFLLVWEYKENMDSKLSFLVPY